MQYVSKFQCQDKNLCGNTKRKRKPTSQISKTTLKSKNKIGGIIIFQLKLYYRGIVIKRTWYWYKNLQEDQWTRIENPEMQQQSYACLFFYKGDKNIH